MSHCALQQPVVLVDFLHRTFGPLYAKNPDYQGCADFWSDGSLQGIKIHFREFLYDFALKRNKLLEILPQILLPYTRCT
jgi:hypothetical protein